MRRSRRNLAPVKYNAREAEAALPLQGRITVIDDEDDEDEDDFPEEQDDNMDDDMHEDLDDDEDDEDLDDSDSSEENSEDERQRVSRQKKRPKRRYIPEAMYAEDVPWKSPLPCPEPDPEELVYHPSVGWLVIYLTTFDGSFSDLGGYGPQDIEEGVVESSVAIHKLFARLLGLVLNRKKEIEYKRYVSALQELHSMLPHLGSTFRLPELQWKSQEVFDLLSPVERLNFLHLLAQWSLQNSKVILAQMSKLGPDSIFCYTGLDDELNRYYFCKGAVGDTRFRLYRETNPYLSVVNWSPVASTIEELEDFTKGLAKQSGELSTSLVQILEEFLPIAREGEERRIKDEKRQRRQLQLAREAAAVKFEPRESRRSRAKRVNYSMLSYDQEFESSITSGRKRERDRDWGSPQPSSALGSRLSRRLRGSAPPEHETLEQLELERQEKEMLKRQSLNGAQGYEGEHLVDTPEQHFVPPQAEPHFMPPAAVAAPATQEPKAPENPQMPTPQDGIDYI